MDLQKGGAAYHQQLIDEITQLEWEMFSAVSNVGGQASCQRDNDTFFVMRKSQHFIWSDDTLESYKTDLTMAELAQVNLMTYKYGYMMAKTFPEEYETIKDQLPEITAEKRALATALTLQHNAWTKEIAAKYPHLCSRGRPLDDVEAGEGTWPSVENYFFCELVTYSNKTLRHCQRDFEEAKKRGENLALEIVKEMARYRGYAQIEDLENALAKIGG